MMKRLLLLLLLLLNCFFSEAQSTIGLPEITNYIKQSYHGGAQTRQVAQDGNGILYFANDEGLLSFNSARWKIYPLPNKSLVRCLKLGPGNKLYIGGQDEFGYFTSSSNGSLSYHSFKHLIPKAASSFADVWEICLADGAIFFQTSDRIYEVRDSTITVHEDSHWRFMGKAGDALIAQSFSRGLLAYRNRAWVPVITAPTVLPDDYFATSLTTIGKDSTLLTTLKHGMYLFTGNQLSKWEPGFAKNLVNKNISSSLMVKDGEIAIGTNLDGCFILDKAGNLIQHLGRKEGLQDNSILTIFLDAQKNIWFGLHNGIDFIPYNNAIKHINPASLKEGAGFASQLYKNDLYVGTSIGLFKFPVNDVADLSAIGADAVEVKNSSGEAWNLSEVNGQLLMGHNEGAFLIRGDEATALDKKSGYWNFQSFTDGASPVMVAGTYRGIAFYKYEEAGFKKMSGEAVVESARFVVTAYNRVWFSHPYKGIYSVSIKDSVSSHKKYGVKEGVLSDNNNYLFKIKNELLLTTETGVYAYNATKDSFEPSPFYNKWLPHLPIRYLKQDKEGNVWFVFEKKIGVLDVSGSSPQVIYFPELTNKFVAGFEHINPIDGHNILIGGEKGFITLTTTNTNDCVIRCRF